MCRCVCIRGVGGCPCAPTQQTLPPGVAAVGPGSARGQDPPGASGAGGTCGSQQPLSPSLPGTAMLLALREGHSPGPQAQPESPTPAGVHCAPQGRGAVHARGQGAAARQPLCPSPPHQPDTGQRWEEIPALSGGWLESLPQLRPLAQNFLVWPSQQHYPGLCLHQAAAEPTGDMASSWRGRFSFPSTLPW